MRIKGTLVGAALVTLALVGWMATGDIIFGGSGDAASNGENLPPVAERRVDEAPFRVRVRNFEAEPYRGTLEINGRTQARATVEVRAETEGRVVERHVEKGARVVAGDPLCRLDAGARHARLAQAQAQLAQAEFDFNAATQLSERGYAAQTQLEAVTATRDAAKAAVAEAELELGRTEIAAPIDGVVQDPIAEVGDRLSMGDTCATIVSLDPILAVGQVSERDIGVIDEGATVSVLPVTGGEAEGAVSFIAAAAEPQTRTFRVEIRVENDDFALRDGVTSRILIPRDAIEAHRLPASVLTLDNEGRIGVRTVDKENRVAFVEIGIIGEDGDGMWVTGLAEVATVITVGQNYVVDGALVQPEVEEASAEVVGAAEVAR